MVTCNKCNLDYNDYVGNFDKSANYKSGYKSHCKKCVAKYNKEYRERLKKGYTPTMGVECKKDETISTKEANKLFKIMQSLIINSIYREVGYDWVNSSERKSFIDAGFYYKELF